MAGMAQFYPLQILIASLAGLINRRQGEVLECRERLGGLLKFYHRAA